MKQGKNSILALIVFLLGINAMALGGDRVNDFDRTKSKPVPNEIVKWTGVVHSIYSGEVDLQFIKSGTKETYDISGSEGLASLNWKDHEARLLEIVAEKTPRFLFWGGDLIVKKYKIIKEIGKIDYQVRRVEPHNRQFER